MTRIKAENDPKGIRENEVNDTDRDVRAVQTVKQDDPKGRICFTGCPNCMQEDGTAFPQKRRKGEHDIKIGKVQEGTGSIHRMDRESVPQSETKQWKTRGMSTGNNKEFVR